MFQLLLLRHWHCSTWFFEPRSPLCSAYSGFRPASLSAPLRLRSHAPIVAGDSVDIAYSQVQVPKFGGTALIISYVICKQNML